MAVPKTIHYCWFGDGYPEKVVKCIESWKIHLPDYEFMLWNESNFDINSNSYVLEAYEAKKWAFVSDYVRLYALYHYGGVYMDTDIEVIKNFDDLMDCRAFTVISDTPTNLRTNFMGSEKGHPWIKRILEYYDNKHFVNEDGLYDMTPNMCVGDIAKERYHFEPSGKRQDLADGIRLYPTEVSGAYDFATDRLNITEDSYVIHWNSASWWTQEQRDRHKKVQKYNRIFGENNAKYVLHAQDIVRNEGLMVLFKKALSKAKKINKHRRICDLE